MNVHAADAARLILWSIKQVTLLGPINVASSVPTTLDEIFTRMTCSRAWASRPNPSPIDIDPLIDQVATDLGLPAKPQLH